MSIDVDVDVYQVLNEKGGGDPNAALREILHLGKRSSTAHIASGRHQTGATPEYPEGHEPLHRRSLGAAPKRKVAVVGAAGSIGAKVVAEAVSRGWDVFAVARDPAKVACMPGVTARRGDANEPLLLSDAVQDADAVVVSVKWASADVSKLLDGLHRSGVKRCIVVVGCGTQIRQDGRLHFQHVAESQGSPPPATVPAVRVLEALRATDDLDWSAATCAIDIAAGDCTGDFRVGGEYMFFDDEGMNRISEEDFAVAIIDEVQEPHFLRRQFTVAY